ncbi:MAG TPA: ATP-binding protein [Thermoanaerobaculia bacterium]|nr:ATP-binding protein [Thermoanaerobaculia bacterium]
MTRTRMLAVYSFAVVAAAALVFWFVLHRVGGLWMQVALRPEVSEALQRSMEDQKHLRKLDPQHSDAYRRRFDETRTLLNRMEVLRMNRAAVLRRYELVMLILFAGAALLAAVTQWIGHRREQQRARLEYLGRVTSLQESARRHAHEIKGPLTAARLELERFTDLARRGVPEAELNEAHDSVSEELERLAKFTREFSSFGGMGSPVLRRESLGQMLEEFCATFANAWPSMKLEERGGDAVVCADRDMLRQVLVNLCTNSSRASSTLITFAIVKHDGRVMLDVRDNGTGVAESLRERIFDPYVTTRRIGEGMGLGLSISRKVMLDHGGDLALLASSAGAVFRVTFGENAC